MGCVTQEKMDFVTETADYNVGDFYDKFVKQLPKIVMVNQGFYGEISADTFDRGQILRLHTVSQQSRVIAKTVHHGNEVFYSIPLSYSSNFCIVKHGKVGKELPLSQLIREYPLPCKVQFPKHKSIDVGSQTIHTDTLPTLELTRSFSEVYLLGNFIVDGVLAQGVVHVPLYLSQLRLSLVTGIVGQPTQKWRSYQEELNRSTLNCEFNKEFGNPDIAVYKPGRIEKVADNADLEYAKIEPNIYTNLSGIFRAGVASRPHLPTVEQPSDDVYETISNPDDGKKQTSMSTFMGNLNKKLSKGSDMHGKKPPPKAPKPVKTKPKPPTNTEVEDLPPPLPERAANLTLDLTRRNLPEPPENHYENNVLQVTPLVQSSDLKPQISHASQFNPMYQEPDFPPETPKLGQKVAVKSLSPDAIDDLSIDDVGEYLKALHLDKFVDVFKDNVIDGKLLKELDRGILREEFQMNNIEALRLMKFITEGHVPS